MLKYGHGKDRELNMGTREQFISCRQQQHDTMWNVGLADTPSTYPNWQIITTVQCNVYNIQYKFMWAWMASVISL